MALVGAAQAGARAPHTIQKCGRPLLLRPPRRAWVRSRSKPPWEQHRRSRSAAGVAEPTPRPSHTCAPRALSPDAASCCSRPHLARATSRRPSGASARPRDHLASSRRHTRRPRPDPACVPIACVLMLACAVCARRHGVGTVVSTFCLIDIDVGAVLSSQALPPSQPSLPSPRAALYPPPQSQTTPPLTPLAQPRV